MRHSLPFKHRRYHAYRCCLTLMEALGRCPTGVELQAEMGLHSTSTGTKWLKILESSRLIFPLPIEVGRSTSGVFEAQAAAVARRTIHGRTFDVFRTPVDKLMQLAA